MIGKQIHRGARGEGRHGCTDVRLLWCIGFCRADANRTPQAPGVARNTLTGPGYRDLDATLTKSFGLPRIPGLGESATIEFRADAFNLSNNLNFIPGGKSNGGGIADNIASPNFGQAQSALGSRMVTLQARFSF